MREVVMALGGWIGISIVTALYLGRVMRLGAVFELDGSETLDGLDAPPPGQRAVDVRASSV